MITFVHFKEEKYKYSYLRTLLVELASAHWDSKNAGVSFSSSSSSFFSCVFLKWSAMVPGGLKNVLHYKNWTFSTQVFSCRFFSSRFSWPFKDFKDSTPKITFPAYKSDFHWQSNAFLWFDFKTHGLLIKEEKRKIILLREIYLLARCLMLNWSRTAAYSYVSLPIKIGAQKRAGRAKRARRH